MSDVARIAVAHGATLVESGGKHNFRFTKQNKTYTVPAHNGMKTEIAWKYIQGLCRNLDIPTSAFTDD